MCSQERGTPHNVAERDRTTNMQKEKIMMTIAEIRNLVSSIEGAALCRSKSMGNFIAIPTDEGYVSVKVGTLLAKDTKTNKAFDIEAATAEYAEFEKAQAERAARPHKEKAVNVEAQARRDMLDQTIATFFEGADADRNYTVTEIWESFPADTFKTIMECGSACKRFASTGAIMCVTEGRKNLYHKA